MRALRKVFAHAFCHLEHVDRTSTTKHFSELIIWFDVPHVYWDLEGGVFLCKPKFFLSLACVATGPYQ